MPKLYIETSVVSYLVAAPSSNIRVAAHQLATHKMWQQLDDYDIYISDIVVAEASKGNPVLAEKRLWALKDFDVLPVTDVTSKLAKQLLCQNAIPLKCPEDALHIAAATVNNLDIIVTWNFKHINNPFMMKKIQKVIVEAGYNFPIICSPEEMLGDEYE